VDTIGFNRVVELFQTARQDRCIDLNEDLVIVVSGDEGSGKTLFSMAIAYSIDPNYSGKQVYYEWMDYVSAQYDALKAQIDGVDSSLGVGSALLYDEAGTQLHSRSSMSKGNIDQVKLFISNRFLRFVHILNVPKPGSLDKYVRNERLKYFVWIDRKLDYYNEKVRATRVAYLWSKNSYMRIYENPYWWQLFNNLGKLIKLCPPDFRCKIPNLVQDKYIPQQLLDEYMTKKQEFNLKQMEEMQGKKEIEKISKIVLPNESKQQWADRTGLSPASYGMYKLKKNNNPLATT